MYANICIHTHITETHINTCKHRNIHKHIQTPPQALDPATTQVDLDLKPDAIGLSAAAAVDADEQESGCNDDDDGDNGDEEAGDRDGDANGGGDDDDGSAGVNTTAGDDNGGDGDDASADVAVAEAAKRVAQARVLSIPVMRLLVMKSKQLLEKAERQLSLNVKAVTASEAEDVGAALMPIVTLMSTLLPEPILTSPHL